MDRDAAEQTAADLPGEAMAVEADVTDPAETAALAETVAEDYGRIVITPSVTGPIVGYPGWTHYSATKAGVLRFMRTAAIEVAQSDITVNAVLPGNITTGGLDDLGEAYSEKMRNMIPKGELGTPEDIGHAVAYLAFEEAGYVTGTSIVVDGGQTLPESRLALKAMDEG